MRPDPFVRVLLALIAGALLLVLGFVLVLFAYRPDIIVTPKGQG